MVRNGDPAPKGKIYDSVSFDNIAGGRQATEHLLSLGHRNIAFLAWHSVKEDSYDASWSLQREAGWREAMSAAKIGCEELSFHPTGSMSTRKEVEEVRAAPDLAQALKSGRDITGVVAANDLTAQKLLQALRHDHVPVSRWPSIVGFDNDPSVQKQLVTSLRLPWPEIGRTAADLLWERRAGQLAGAPQHRTVAMRLIPRLTCRKDWSQAGHQAALTTMA